jgi:hypothetical protein
LVRASKTEAGCVGVVDKSDQRTPAQGRPNAPDDAVESSWMSSHTPTVGGLIKTAWGETVAVGPATGIGNVHPTGLLNRSSNKRQATASMLPGSNAAVEARLTSSVELLAKIQVLPAPPNAVRLAAENTLAQAGVGLAAANAVTDLLKATTSTIPLDEN